MGRTALRIEATTFQFFLRNPRGARAKPMDEEDAAALRGILDEHAFAPVMGHAPYILNPCSATPRLRELAREILTDDLARLEHLPGNYYVLHPGNHGGQGMEAGVSLTGKTLDSVLRPDMRTTVLLETMVGKGSEIGGTFRELAMIIRASSFGERLGVCLDTCHVWDAGYDIVTRLDAVLEEFDRELGLTRLKAVHINDSMNPLGAKKDRHAKLGQGAIGLAAMERIITHPSLRGLPFCLETPCDLAGHTAEIAMLRRMTSAT